MTLAKTIGLLVLTMLVVGAAVCGAAVLPVCPDATCTYPTIQAAIVAAADGDTVLLANGIYRGDGNRDLDYGGKAITVRSASGDRALCIVDCETTGIESHRGFWFHSFEGPQSRLEAITIRNASAGVECWGATPQLLPVPAITNCAIRSCEDGVLVGNASTLAVTTTKYDARELLSGCDVSGNTTGLKLVTRGAAVTVAGTSFSDNTASGVDASAVDAIAGLLFTDCEIARNGGTGLSLSGAFVRMTMQNSSVSDNHGEGLSLWGNQDEQYVINGCSIQRNTSHGIMGPGPWSDHDLLVSDCVITDNGACGLLDSSGPYGVFIRTSNISRNGGDGISYGGFRKTADAETPAGLGSIQGCQLFDNGGCGIRFYGFVLPGLFSITQNVLFRNAEAGLLFGGSPDAGPAQLEVASNTIVRNGGPGIVLNSIMPTTITHCIVAFNEGPALDVLSGPLPTFSCSNLFGNLGGDWTADIFEQTDLPGNFSADPCFCDLETGVLTLSGDSWCLPGRYQWGCAELVGSLGEGCDGRGCAPVVAVMISNFVALVTGDEIAVSWRVEGDLDRMELRLLASAGALAWEVPFTARTDGSCFADDRSGLAALRATSGVALCYALQLATENGWTLLSRQEIGGDATSAQSLTLDLAPNPFNPQTTIHFNLPSATGVRLAIYDLTGRLIRVLEDRDLPAGRNEAVWDGRDTSGRTVASGSYIARLNAGMAVRTVRMGLVR